MSMRLLVSVRDAIEAEAAAAAGADIIDVKEPSNGPLGFAGAAEIQRIVDAVAGRAPVSAALGECTEWLNSNGFCATDRSLNLQHSALQFVKLGLAGTAPTHARQPVVRDKRSSRAWHADWATVRTGLTPESATAPDWVAVAYADVAVAQSPAPEEIMATAIQTRCTAFLIDTYQKTGPGTLDCLPEARLLGLRNTARENGLQFALAGRLTAQHLDAVNRISPDILGVRGAVCERTDRNSRISGKRIRHLQERLKEQATFAS